MNYYEKIDCVLCIYCGVLCTDCGVLNLANENTCCHFMEIIKSMTNGVIASVIKK